MAQSNAYQFSSRYDGDWSSDYMPLFARHYPRRMEGEEVHDAIAKATGVLGGYTVQYPEGNRSTWAMQMPDPVEPRGNEGNANVFMSTFLRGNRDNLQRSQSGSIQQQLYLMNDRSSPIAPRWPASPKLEIDDGHRQGCRPHGRGVSHLPLALPHRLRAPKAPANFLKPKPPPPRSATTPWRIWRG